ncbi:MAG: metallophosphoesterase [Candidatus Brocadiaceae bacterium]|nr:metallophosphoesterase [Candidatus Brocadiaceae bacterium]
MKILSFGDIHEDTSNLAKMQSVLGSADLILISGDITNCHGKATVKTVLDAVRKYNTNLYAQYGNMDLPEVNKYLTDEGINLHGYGYIFKDVGIFGCGGSSPTPFHTPSEISETEIERCLTNGFKMVEPMRWKIMVCHTPPKDTKIDMIRGGAHVGSDSVKRFIEKRHPDVCISGHIHESRGQDKIGNTLVLNAGMFRDGWYIEIIIAEEGITASLKSVDYRTME